MCVCVYSGRTTRCCGRGSIQTCTPHARVHKEHVTFRQREQISTPSFAAAAVARADGEHFPTRCVAYLLRLRGLYERDSDMQTNRPANTKRRSHLHSAGKTTLLIFQLAWPSSQRMLLATAAARLGSFDLCADTKSGRRARTTVVCCLINGRPCVCAFLWRFNSVSGALVFSPIVQLKLGSQCARVCTLVRVCVCVSDSISCARAFRGCATKNGNRWK